MSDKLTEERWAGMWTALGVMFPDMNDRLGNIEQTVAMAQYFDALKDLPADELAEAVRRYNRDGRFFPKPRDLRDKVLEIRKDKMFRDSVPTSPEEYYRVSFLNIRRKEYMGFLDLDYEEAKSKSWLDWTDKERGLPIRDLRKERDRLTEEGSLTYHRPHGRRIWGNDQETK